MTPPVVLVSNRGPLSFSLDEAGHPVARRGAGGLVSGLLPLVDGTDTLWIAAALSDADRVAASGGLLRQDGVQARLVDLDPTLQRAATDVVCNATLWFVHHHLFDLPRRPRFDRAWWDAWDAYREVNAAFADVVAERAPEGAAVLLQDYHLYLVATTLAKRRPDLRAVHFSHTPFAGPDALSILPDGPRREVLDGLAAHHACGFHTERWRAAFEASCAVEPGRAPRTFVAPLGPDVDALEDSSSGPACFAAGAELDEQVGGRRLIVRVDRVELSKNLLRGFHAYDQLLHDHPEWRGRVVFGAFCYPSREGLADYLAYQQEVTGLVRQVNERWATGDWTPILYEAGDDYPRSLAALQRYDVLLVNPVRDGLNLVAKEGPLLNRRDGVVILSRGAGAWADLEAGVVEAHPYDVVGTAEALHAALEMPADERAQRASLLREAAAAHTPATWLHAQLEAAGR